MTKQKTIKEAVVEEVRNKGWTPSLDVGMSYVETAIDLTLDKFASLLKSELLIAKDDDGKVDLQVCEHIIDKLSRAKSVEDKNAK